VLREDFVGDDAGAISVVTTAGLGDDVLASYAGELSALPHVVRVESRLGTFVDGGADLTDRSAAPAQAASASAERLSVVTDREQRSDDERDLVATIRGLDDPGGTEALVGGQTAELVDSMHAIGSRLPLAVGWMVVTTFVILFLFTGSVIQPVRALLLNALGLSATLGAMVWVFQQGHLADVLGFTPMPLDTSMLVLLLCVAFGLSMDYEVFVMGRIKEMRDLGLPNDEAVVRGLAHTGRIVSTAAALIAISFFAFLVSRVSFIQFFGLGAGLAILIDATLVRGVLVPAAMRILGEQAWWAPRPLRRLHRRVGLSESAPAPLAGEHVGV
jgi:RND superfamily putative drug exporter